MSSAYDKISQLIRLKGISCFSPIPLSSCKLIRPHLLERSGINAEKGSAIMLAVPYLVRDNADGNLSEYAKSQDYHLFFKLLFDDIIPTLREEFPSLHFEGFTDHSPIDEINAAALAGLGMIGKNGLLITEKYSSFVFVGEIITDLEIECAVHKIQLCESCGKCQDLCPVGCDIGRCLSALTQKKGALSPEESQAILENGSAWGCDLCQKVCPYTESAIRSGSIYTNIPFFYEKRLPFLTYDVVEAMSDDDFRKRAYSWRGKQTILRNLLILYPSSNESSKK